MEELYFQEIGKLRVVSVIGWSSKEVLLEDLSTGLKYTMSWEIFFKYHRKMEPATIDISDYTGPNLTI